MYCTTARLADAKLSHELAQVATPERYRIVSDALMEATLRNEDRSAFDPADVAIADEALVVVTLALQAADGLIDGYLVMRRPTPYVVPLNPVPGIVSTWARWIARYLLHKDRVSTEERTDPVVRDYKDALKFLALVRDGQFSLGAEDPLPASSAGAPEFCAPERQFTMNALKDY